MLSALLCRSCSLSGSATRESSGCRSTTSPSSSHTWTWSVLLLTYLICRRADTMSLSRCTSGRTTGCRSRPCTARSRGGRCWPGGAGGVATTRAAGQTTWVSWGDVCVLHSRLCGPVISRYTLVWLLGRLWWWAEAGGKLITNCFSLSRIAETTAMNPQFHIQIPRSGAAKELNNSHKTITISLPPVRPGSALETNTARLASN